MLSAPHATRHSLTASGLLPQPPTRATMGPPKILDHASSISPRGRYIRSYHLTIGPARPGPVSITGGQTFLSVTGAQTFLSVARGQGFSSVAGGHTCAAAARHLPSPLPAPWRLCVNHSFVTMPVVVTSAWSRLSTLDPQLSTPRRSSHASHVSVKTRGAGQVG